MGTRWRVVGVVGFLLIACVAIGAFAITRTSSKSVYCAGVGLNGPSAATPEGAPAAWLDKEGGDAADWKRGDRRTSDPDFGAPYDSYDFTPRDPISVPTLKLITVDNHGGTWRASGGCVHD